MRVSKSFLARRRLSLDDDGDDGEGKRLILLVFYARCLLMERENRRRGEWQQSRQSQGQDKATLFLYPERKTLSSVLPRGPGLGKREAHQEKGPISALSQIVLFPFLVKYQ